MADSDLYLTTKGEIASIASAIRSKGGTSNLLVYPSGFVSAIAAIPTGSVDVDDIIVIGDYGLCFNNFTVSGNICTSAAGTVSGNTLIAV
jgi:hypothetical protein